MSLPQIVNLIAVRQRRAFLAVAVAVLGTVAVVTFTLPDLYRAQATLLVGSNRPVETGAGSVQFDEVLARTYAQLLRSADVRAAVADELPFAVDVGDLDDRVAIDVVAGTQLIRVEAEDARPERAQLLADTYAATFAARQATAGAEARGTQQAELEQRIGELAGTVERLRSTGNAAALARAEAQLQASREAYSATQRSEALEGSNLAVASRASLPTAPAAPRPKLYLLMGSILALALAGAAALAFDRFDDRLRDEDELLAAVPAPILTRVPHRRGGDSRAVSEAYDVLCANLRADDPLGDRRLLMITSAVASEGKSFSVMRLAEAFARRDIRVLAVDCDLRRPTLSPTPALLPGKGVSSLLVEEMRDPASLVVQSESPGVMLLPAGPAPPGPGALLATQRVRSILASLRDTYDVVLVDSPPVPAGADATTLGQVVDGVLLVVDLQRTRRRALRTTCSQLERAGVPVLGIVLNQMRGWDRDQYGYYGPTAPRGPTTGELRWSLPGLSRPT